MTTLNWKLNHDRWEARASQETGGRYVVSRHLHFWNVDHRRPRGRMRRQLGFAYTAEGAKDLAQADNDVGQQRAAS
jgi:hypothetical protein